MSIASDDIFLAEIDVNVAGAEATVFATGDSEERTAGGDVFYPRLKSPFVGLARSMFPPGATRGQAPQGVGEVELRNDDGFYDYLKRAAFTGRRLVVRRGQVGDLASYPSGFSTVLDGAMGAPDWTPESANSPSGALRIQARDARKYASVAYVTDTYAGDNVAGAGLEGTADDLKGKTKCDGFGRMFNVPLVCVNAEKNIWQAVNGAVDSFDAVRDSGFPLSNSGIIFEPNTTPFTNVSDGIYSVAWSGSIWVAVGYNSSSLAPICLSSPDGVTWTSRTLTGFGAADQAYCVGYGNGLFVVGGGLGGATPGTARISTSPDGITWTSRTPTGFTTGNVRSVVYSSDAALWVAVGASGQMASSTNGTVWTSRTSGTGTTLTSVTFGRGVFVAAALDAGIYTSRDAVTWTARTTQFANTGFLTIAYTSLGFFAAGFDLTSGNPGANSSAFSEDGISWILKASFTGLSSASLAFAEDDGRVFTIAGSSLWSTIDGDTWIERPNAFPNTVGVGASTVAYTIAAGNGSLLVAGNTILDGAVAWTTIAAVEYANTTDLEDDNLAPPAGSYIACPSAGYVRLAGTASFVGQITADIVEGASAALRTYGQYFVRACERAGLVSFPNLVTNPSALATGWTTGGTTTATNAAATRKGYSFSRINNADGGVLARPVTLTGNTMKVCSWLILSNGVAGVACVGLYDDSAPAWRLRIDYTVSASGAVTAEASDGTLLSVRNLGGGISLVTGLSDTVTAANSHLVYANTNPAVGLPTLTSVLMSDVTVKNATEEDDWLAFDIVALDDAQPAEIGDWIAPGENRTCGDIFAKLERAGFSIFADQYGVLRIQRLDDPAPNLITNPSDLASAPWSVGGGTPVATNAVGVFAGKSFSRITAADTGTIIQTVTLEDDGEYYLTVYVRSNGVDGTAGVLLFDADAAVSRINVQYTIASGVVTVTLMSSGTHVRTASLGDGVYGITVKGSGVVAANINRVYGLNAGSATSVQLSDFLLVAGAPDVSIDQNELAAPFTPVRSADENDGTPSYRVTVQWGKNYLVQTSDLAFETSESLKTQIAREFREAIAEDADILTRHPTSRPRVVESMFASESDAIAEADRLIALEALDLQHYRVTVKVTDDTQDGSIATKSDALAALDLNGIYEQAHARYGLGAGKRFRLTAIQPRTESMFSYLTFDLLG